MAERNAEVEERQSRSKNPGLPIVLRQTFGKRTVVFVVAKKAPPALVKN